MCYLWYWEPYKKITNILSPLCNFNIRGTVYAGTDSWQCIHSLSEHCICIILALVILVTRHLVALFVYIIWDCIYYLLEYSMALFAHGTTLLNMHHIEKNESIYGCQMYWLFVWHWGSGSKQTLLAQWLAAICVWSIPCPDWLLWTCDIFVTKYLTLYLSILQFKTIILLPYYPEVSP